MTVKLRIAAAVLALISALSAASCASSGKTGGDTSGAAGTTAAAETENEKLLPNLPASDFEGCEFTFAHWDLPDWNKLCCDIANDENDGEVINDAVFRRNTTVEGKYNIKVKCEYINYETLNNIIKEMSTSGDCTYDVVMPMGAYLQYLISPGYFTDLNKLGYVDFEQPWWDINSVRDLSLGNKLFAVGSDISLYNLDAASAIVFNKKEFTDLGLGDPYQLVNDKVWTIDKLYELSKGQSRDLDGDGEYGDDDFYAFLAQNDVLPTFFNGGGNLFSEKDSDDYPTASFNTEKNVTLIVKILDMMNDETYFYNGHYHTNLDTRADFKNGQGLFGWAMFQSIRDMRAYDIEFGVLPIPMAYENQDRYYTAVAKYHASFISVSSAMSPEAYDRTGFILEALSAESKYTVIPAYYEVALKGKYIRDDESAGMLDIIRNSFVYDLGDYLCFGNLQWAITNTLTQEKSTDVASLYAKYEKAYEKDIENLIKYLQRLD